MSEQCSLDLRERSHVYVEVFGWLRREFGVERVDMSVLWRFRLDVVPLLSVTVRGCSGHLERGLDFVHIDCIRFVVCV